jgi:putative heme-binding domain-containing protein
LESVAGPRVGGELAAGLADAGDAARRAALELLLRRDAWHALLLEALESGRLPRGEVRADDRRKLLAGADDAERARIERLLGASNPARGEVLARVAPAASMRGDAVRGRTIHQQKCAVCHRFGGEGGEVGPALDGMGKHPASELLAEIVDPNRSVEANYRLWLLETTDEVVVSGRLVEENERYIELLDAGGKRLRLERAEIAAMKRSDSSVMPEGLVDDLPLEDIAALLAFLATDGGAAGHPR